jgi:acyl-CoA oxidase
MAVVFAQLVVGGEVHGVHVLLAPIRDTNGATMPGVRIEDCGPKLGLNGVDNGRIWFDHVRVPRENLLNRYANVTAVGEYVSPIDSPSKRFFTTIGALVAGRVSVALGALSAMKSGLAIAIRYGDRRRQFGAAGADEVRLLDYRTHQRKLLPRLASAYALDFALKYLVDRFVNRTEEDQRDIEKLAAGLKAYTTWANIESLQVCREACGGQGYMSENRFAELKADTDIFCTFEGDNTVLMQLVVKSLLSDYRRQFEDARPFTLLKYVAARAADAVREPQPLAARNTDRDHLRGSEFHLDAFRYREQRLLGSLARRLKHRLDQGMDSFFALVDVQDHVMAAANAHAESLVMEQFAAGVARCEDPAVRTALARLAALFALSRIEADRGWFLEAGYLSTAKSHAIREQVNILCAELRPDAVGLADGFGIPNQLLGAPIAMP